MLSDIRQAELDLAEETLLRAIFGSETPGPKATWLLNFLGLDINAWLRDFEYLVRPMMDDQGRIIGSLARDLLREKWPKIADLIPRDSFRLVDFVNPLAGLIESLKGKLR